MDTDESESISLRSENQSIGNLFEPEDDKMIWNAKLINIVKRWKDIFVFPAENVISDECV